MRGDFDAHHDVYALLAGLCLIENTFFGTDQMLWPGALGIAVETVESAPFLSEDQKRDIFYNNGARFLRLSEDEIARHNGM